MRSISSRRYFRKARLLILKSPPRFVAEIMAANVRYGWKADIPVRRLKLFFFRPDLLKHLCSRALQQRFVTRLNLGANARCKPLKRGSVALIQCGADLLQLLGIERPPATDQVPFPLSGMTLDRAFDCSTKVLACRRPVAIFCHRCRLRPFGNAFEHRRKLLLWLKGSDDARSIRAGALVAGGRAANEGDRSHHDKEFLAHGIAFRFASLLRRKHGLNVRNGSKADISPNV